MISQQRTFISVLPTRRGRKPAGIDMERNYVTATLWIYLVRLRLARSNAIQSNVHFVIPTLQPDRTRRLDVFEEVRLTSTSFLKAILERVDGCRINIFPRQAVPSVYNPLRKEVQTCITSTIFLHQLPAVSSAIQVSWAL